MFFFLFRQGLETGGHGIRNGQYFDTIRVNPSLPVEEIKARAEAHEINFRYFPDGDVIEFIWLKLAILILIDIYFRLASRWTRRYARKISTTFSPYSKWTKQPNRLPSTPIYCRPA